jgi:hypothetical protein
MDALALVFMIAGFSTRFFAMWFIDTKGLGISVLSTCSSTVLTIKQIFVAALVNTIGGWIRFFPGSLSSMYYVLLVGQILCAISQSFIDIAGM